MERTDDIGFGGLTLTQDTDDFCYGIDAVLLADFAAGSDLVKKRTGKGIRVADLGCGNGIVPLILSQKIPESELTGVEFDENRAGLAVRNVENNSLAGRIRIVRADVLDIIAGAGDQGLEALKESFDMVSMNPPYVKTGAGMMNPDAAKMTARHETTAGIEEFLKAACLLLKDRGEAALVHRPSRLTDIMSAARSMHMEPKQMRLVSPRAGAAPNICLVRFTKNGGAELEILPELIVRKEDGNYTEEIEKIYDRY